MVMVYGSNDRSVKRIANRSSASRCRILVAVAAAGSLRCANHVTNVRIVFFPGKNLFSQFGN